MKKVFGGLKRLLSAVPEERAYRILQVLLLSGIGILCGGELVGIRTVDGWTALTVCILVCFSAGLFPGRDGSKGAVRWGYLAGAAAAAVAVVLFLGASECLAFLRSYGSWLTGRAGWQQEWVRGYEMVQVLLVVCVCFRVRGLTERSFRWKIALAALMLAGLFFCLFTRRQISHGGVSLALLYLALVAAEGVRRRWEKVKKRGAGDYLFWLGGVWLVYLLGVLLLPAPEQPYDWRYVKSAYAQTKELVEQAVARMRFWGTEEYSFAYTGFSGEAHVGGNVEEQDREVMRLLGQRNLKTNVYLTGRVYDTFDGRQWLQENTSDEAERYLDTLETVYAVQRYDKEYFRDYLSRVELVIRYRYFRSDYLFAPLKAWSIRQGNEDLYHRQLGGSLLFGEVKGLDTEYRIGYYQMNTGHKAFSGLLEAEYEPDEEILENLLTEVSKKVKKEVTEADLGRHRELVREYYTGEVELSEEVRAYLEQITEGAESGSARLRAIERELASFAYNQTPGALPEQVHDAGTFLDFFLLESRQGYCTHFATAFVLLARAEGYPARYVQGFCVPADGDEETAVYSNMAHAWPEVYIENVGWVPFEPTPGFRALRYKSWAVLERQSGEPKDADDSMQEEAMRRSLEEQEEEAQEEEAQEDAVRMDKEASALRRILRILAVGLGAAAVFLAAVILFLLLARTARRVHYRKLDVAGRYRAEMERNFRLLSRLGVQRRENETIEELGVRAAQTLALTDGLELEHYEAVRYGDRAVTEGMLSQAVSEREQLLKLLKGRGKLGYYFALLTICSEIK